MALVPQGNNSPGTLVNDTSVGTVAWANPGNASANDSSYTTASLTLLDPSSNYLKTTNFGFNIPSGATISGIITNYKRYRSDTNPGTSDFSDNAVRIVKGGVIGTSDKSLAGSWATTDNGEYVSYGSNTDLWALPWTPSDINASNFGCALSGQIVNDADTGNIDHVTITVYYEPAAGDPAGQDVQSQMAEPGYIDSYLQPII